VCRGCNGVGEEILCGRRTHWGRGPLSGYGWRRYDGGGVLRGSLADDNHRAVRLRPRSTTVRVMTAVTGVLTLFSERWLWINTCFRTPRVRIRLIWSEGLDE